MSIRRSSFLRSMLAKRSGESGANVASSSEGLFESMATEASFLRSSDDDESDILAKRSDGEAQRRERKSSDEGRGGISRAGEHERCPLRREPF